MSNQITSQEEKQMNVSEKHSNIFNEFFWICSGANRRILRQCPTEYSKYFGIGGTIFFTAAMATLSGGYAFYTIFHSVPMAVFFGIFWGLLIFNLDRFIVNTMYTDGKYTISWGELGAGTPRLIIAIFLGIVISTPLEMKIFEDRINSQIIKDNARRTNDTRDVANKDYMELHTLEIKRDSLAKARNILADRLAAANLDLKQEAEGTALSGKVGHGTIYNDKEAYRNTCQKAIDDWDRLNGTQMSQLENSITVAQAKVNKFEEDIKDGLEDEGFCVRYEAFSNIKKEVPAVRIVSIFIMLLLIIIEIAPTFFKMMIASGPYDELLREEMERKKTQAITNVSKIHDDANTQIQISVAKNAERLKAELAANQEVLSKIAAVQAELLETAIEEWRKAELEKIKSNPSQYIKSNTTNA